MKYLLSTGRYNSGKRPSEHKIGETSFLKDCGGSIAHNLFELENMDSAREVRLPNILNSFSFSNSNSNDFFSKTCKTNGITPHPARMPMGLAAFFIEFLTDPGDLVLDPFAGSNTTGYAAARLNRKWIAIDAEEKYVEQSRIRFQILPLSTSISNKIMSITQQLTTSNLFKRKSNGDWDTGFFVGRPFRLSYSKAEILVADAWKQRAKGIPQGCFLLAYYDNELDDKNNTEAILLRVIQPTKLPTDQDVISSMVEYYKDDIKTGETKRSQLDSFTRYEFSFSGLECSVLGSFYVDGNGRTRFGADLETSTAPIITQ